MSTIARSSEEQVVRATLESVGDARIILGIPGTDYELHLVPGVPASQITTPVGKAIRGVIEAHALRLFAAKGGGRFIEPIAGEPRIVAGIIRAVDPPQRRILLDVAVPMWITLDALQRPEKFNVGELVNCYVQSGARFTPVR